MGRVKNKTVLVTGGALGIGRETCLLLAKEGANVAVTDVLEEEGAEVVNEIKKNGGNAHFWKLDVSKEQEVKKVIDAAVKEFGSLDAIVNNAGISGADKPTDEMTEKEWDLVMDINVKGVFFGTKYAVPHMRKSGGGSIVNLSSVYGLVGANGKPAYNASKGAVRLMTKNDALLFAKDNIRVNSVHPGFIWTPMIEKMNKENPAFKDYLLAKHPIGHLGEPIDIAYAILYLVSDESKFCTGSEMIVDGGYTCI